VKALATNFILARRYTSLEYLGKGRLYQCHDVDVDVEDLRAQANASMPAS